MDEAERKKAAQLLKEIRESGNEKEGGSEKRLTWMYKGPNDMIDLEEYLLGKAIDKTFEGNSNGDNSEIMGRIYEPSNVPKRLLAKPESAEQVDIAKKILEDPLYAIKQKELEARRKLLDNPVKLKELKKMIMEGNKKKLERKKQKKKQKSKDLVNDENALNKKILKKLRILSESHRRKLLEEAAESSDTSSESDAKRGKKSRKKRKLKSKESSDSDSESEDSRKGIKRRRKSDVYRKKNTEIKKSKVPYNRRDETERASKRNRSVSKNKGEKNRIDKRKRKSKRSSSSDSDSSSSDSSSSSSSGSSSSDSSSESSDSSASEDSSSETSGSERGRSKKKVRSKKEKYGDQNERSIPKRKDNNTDAVGKTEKNLPLEKGEKETRKDKRSHPQSYSFSDRNHTVKRDYRRYREDNYPKVRGRFGRYSGYKRGSKRDSYDRSFKRRFHNASSSSKSMSEKERSHNTSSSSKNISEKERSHNTSSSSKNISEKERSHNASSSSKNISEKERSHNTSSSSKNISEKERSHNASSSSKNISEKERSHNASSSSKNISEKEIEDKLREMMENAKVRKEEREKNLALHRKIQSEEEKQDYDDGFMRRQISHATSQGTVADRIRSNVNNIQRSKDDMDRSFVRK